MAPARRYSVYGRHIHTQPRSTYGQGAGWIWRPSNDNWSSDAMFGFETLYFKSKSWKRKKNNHGYFFFASRHLFVKLALFEKEEIKPIVCKWRQAMMPGAARRQKLIRSLYWTKADDAAASGRCGCARWAVEFFDSMILFYSLVGPGIKNGKRFQISGRCCARGL